MNFITKFFFVIALLAISVSLASAQDGQIRGIVKDSTTGEPLVGSNVWLEGTSYGASTDLEGMYTISRIPVGSYTLRIRYIGYRDRKVEITIKEGSDLVMNFSLIGQAVEGEEVIVTAQAQGQRGAIVMFGSFGTTQATYE